jgi:EpsD family peptidyl-prolyl cis-trans isomerase
MRTPNLRFTPVVIATALLLGLSACGSKDASKPATQVAAKVGSEEISIHQINQILSRTNTDGATAQDTQAVSREVLEKLIDQQLAVDQAIDAKLHRTPEVVAQLEAVRREILANAYLQQIASAIAKPSAEEAAKFYAENPQLFSARRIFNVQEIVVPASAVGGGVADQLRDFAQAGKPLEESAAWLKSKEISFGGGTASRPAEQVPLELLPRLHALKDGQITVIESPKSLTLLRLVSSQPAPIAQAAAIPRIEQFLANKHANEAVTEKLKQLRNSVKIAYLGDFGTADGAPAPVVHAAPAPDQSSVIEKGVAGLKK